MKTKSTKELMQKFRSLLNKRHYVNPETVKTREEAIELTKNDPTGTKWHVGDAYFKIIK
jgi:hypothetical protein